jgi:hypothetical protein
MFQSEQKKSGLRSIGVYFPEGGKLLGKQTAVLAETES